MARTKTKPRTKTPSRKAVDEKDPRTWLFENPDGSTGDGFVFAVLRKVYNKRANSAAELAWRKCHVGPDYKVWDPSVWQPNIERLEVLLPEKADDLLADPVTLMRQVDEFAAPNQAGLLTYLSLPLGDADRVHIAWERSRAFARRLASERKLASLVMLHAPGLIGADLPLHAHLLIIPRQISGLGMKHAPYDRLLVHDDGQDFLHGMWAKHREGGV